MVSIVSADSLDSVYGPFRVCNTAEDSELRLLTLYSSNAETTWVWLASGTWTMVVDYTVDISPRVSVYSISSRVL